MTSFGSFGIIFILFVDSLTVTIKYLNNTLGSYKVSQGKYKNFIQQQQKNTFLIVKQILNKEFFAFVNLLI